MIDEQTALDRCTQLIEAAQRHGADSADAVASANSSESVSVRLGKLEEVERSEGEEIGLRVFVGHSSASIQTSDFSPAAIDELAERAVAMARAAPSNPHAGIAPEDLLARGPFPDLDLRDSGEPSPESLRERALETEDAARGVAGVTNSEGGSASFSRALSAMVASNGFSGAYSATGHGLSASVIAGEGADMQRDYAWRTARHVSDLIGPAEIGRLAGERAVGRLRPAQLKSGKLPVVFDPRVGGTLVSHLVGAMSGPSVARGGSFLVGKQEEDLFPDTLCILEEPHRPRGLSSRPFDAEGLPTIARALVENGRITGWLTNLASARQLDVAPSGHAARSGGGAPGVSVSNVHIAAGTISREELIGDIEDGVLVTELIGQGVNGVTGDYSRGAAGFRIERGEITGPVADFTIAGNLLAMFAALTPASDLEMYRSVNIPTLRVDGMTIAGE